AERGEPIRGAAVYDGQVLCLDDGGNVGAWDLKSAASAKEISARLSRKGLASLAADGEKLWAADGSTVYRWSGKDRAWDKAAGFEAGDETLVEVVPVGGSPFLVFPSPV